MLWFGESFWIEAAVTDQDMSDVILPDGVNADRDIHSFQPSHNFVHLEGVVDGGSPLPGTPVYAGYRASKSRFFVFRQLDAFRVLDQELALDLSTGFKRFLM